MKPLYFTPADLLGSVGAIPPVSDLQGDSRVRVAGRVFDIAPGEASTSLRLVDACGSVKVDIPSQNTELQPGDYAVILGDLVLDAPRLRSLKGAVLEQRWPAPMPSETSEFWQTATGTRGTHIALRGALLRQIRSQFEQAGFLEVDTPVRVVSPGSDAYVNAFSSEGRYLITSPEHHMKRLVAAGFSRIFQLAHCFRKDESGHLHQPEFLMLEWYRAFAGQLEMMDDTESIVVATVERTRALASALYPNRNERPSENGDYLSVGELMLDLKRPFDRLSMRDAFREFAGVADAVALAGEDEASYFQTFVDHVEPALAKLSRPVFLCDFPSTQAALALHKPSDPSVAERFELYLAGVELCNGYSELTLPEEFLRREAEEKARKQHSGQAQTPGDEALLHALQAGFPPCGGNALGVDRLLALALGKRDIREIVTFVEPGAI